MSNEKKDALIASIDKVEAVNDFLTQWYSAADLYKTAAKAGSILMELVNMKSLADEDVKVISCLMDQHVMMTELLAQFEERVEL